MTDEEKTILLRRYGAGGITWQSLRERGLGNYIDVLGDLGLRLPVAPMEVPNVEIRLRARARIREALRQATR